MSYTIHFNDVTHTSTFIENGELFLKIEGQSEHGRFVIPKIALNSLVFEHETSGLYYGSSEPVAALYSAEITLTVIPVDSVLIEFIGNEEPAQEMTIAQIQKELGYKIKIKE